MEGVSQLERDIDVMRDVYMLPSQQDAYARILQAALSARAQGEGEPVAWLCEAEARVPPAFVRSEEVARETYERVGYNITPLYTAAPKQQAVEVDDAMVARAVDAYAAGHFECCRRHMRAALTAALTQPEAE